MWGLPAVRISSSWHDAGLRFSDRFIGSLSWQLPCTPPRPRGPDVRPQETSQSAQRQGVGGLLCERLFLSPPRVAARIRRAPPGGPQGEALHRRARGLLGFDLPRCTVPMFLMLSMQSPLRLPQRISALFDQPLLFGIHPDPPYSPGYSLLFARCGAKYASPASGGS
jgi:hypothetical protein